MQMSALLTLDSVWADTVLDVPSHISQMSLSAELSIFKASKPNKSTGTWIDRPAEEPNDLHDCQGNV